FSSRRRHTRFDCDWSSDVCSSDLGQDKGETASSEISCRGERPVGRRVDIGGSRLLFARIGRGSAANGPRTGMPSPASWSRVAIRSEEHTSELQSQSNLVCRLLLAK